MPTIESSIETALFSRVASLSLSPELTVSWPNQTLKTKPATYLRVSHVPNINDRPFIDSDAPHLRLGLLEIDVFVKKGSPPRAAAATEIAGKIAEHFSTDLEMVADGVVVQVAKAPDVRQAMPGETHWMVPVVIRYECFA
ncbi:phage tail terminator-like protein [Nitratireductor sp. StC3]|uniref:phage tail terminator-like protein n=1 Tax=Nitratireductor sp. StC3 TaxID=2126741 RepID=UPI000D0CEB96|nr:phage tail terminator-like protein [Nitratireductor sp. StC3]PSM18221.1 hypothetical protein C7T96_10140 [Nitratireductor sp. StC3]